MQRHDLTHSMAGEILGISERASRQYAAGRSSSTGEPLKVPTPVEKLMRLKDAGVTIDV